MRSRPLFLSVILVVAAFVGTAEAATITLTAAQIDSFVFSVAKSSSNVVSGSNNFNGFFDVDFDFGSPGAGLGVFELTGLSISYSAGDVFWLFFTNNDFSDWGFEAVVMTDAGDFTSGVTTISTAFASSLSATLASGSTITGVEIRVSGSIPNTSNPGGIPDVAADWRVSNFMSPPPMPPVSVPEPASALRLLLGLGSLGFIRRRA